MYIGLQNCTIVQSISFCKETWRSSFGRENTAQKVVEYRRLALLGQRPFCSLLQLFSKERRQIVLLLDSQKAINLHVREDYGRGRNPKERRRRMRLKLHRLRRRCLTSASDELDG